MQSKRTNNKTSNANGTTQSLSANITFVTAKEQINLSLVRVYE